MNGIFSSGTRLEIRQNIFALYVLFAVGGRVQSRLLYLQKNIGQFIRMSKGTLVMELEMIIVAIDRSFAMTIGYTLLSLVNPSTTIPVT